MKALSGPFFKVMVLFLVGAGCCLAHAKNSLIQLSSARTQFHQGNFILDLKLSQPLAENNLQVEYNGDAIDLQIPSIQLDKGFKKANPVKRDNIHLVYIYQTKDSVRARIIFDPKIKANEYEGKVAVLQNGNDLRIRVQGVAAQAQNQTKAIPIQVTKKAKAAADLPVVAPDVLSVSGDQDTSGTTDAQLNAAITQAVAASGQNSTGTSHAAAGATGTSVATGAAASSKTTTAAASTNKTSTPATSAQSESEMRIPSLTAAHGHTDESPLRKMVLAMAVVCMMGFGILFALKKWGKSNVRKSKENTKIQIVTQHHLGPKKSLAIVHVAGESVLIGITEQNISMIKSLSLIDDEIPEQLPPRFSTAMRNVDEPKLSIPLNKAPEIRGEEDDEFAARDLHQIQGLVTDRLKGMRNFL